MVARSIDAPRTSGDRVKDASARLDEVSRQLGRGAPALRNNAGHVVELDPDAAEPTLRVKDTDVTVRFGPAGGEVRDASGDELRDWTVRDLRVTGTITVDSDVQVGGTVNVDGGVSAAGTVYSGTKLDAARQFVIGPDASGRPIIYSPSVDAAMIAYNGEMYFTNNTNSGLRSVRAASVRTAYDPSEARLKDITGLTDPQAAGATLDALTARTYTFTSPDVHPNADDAEHIGFVVDELAADPRTAWLVTEPDGFGARSWRVRDVVAALVADRARAHARINTLERRLDELIGGTATPRPWAPPESR